MTTTYELYTNENGTPKAVEGKAPAIIERVEALETNVKTLDGDIKTLDGDIKTLDEDVGNIQTAIEVLEGGVVKTINGETPDQAGNIDIPVGHNVGEEWVSYTGKIPNGGVPYCGQTVTRATYADLWAYAQAQGLVKTESEWQSWASSHGGNVPYYSGGNGSTTFRMPKLVGYIKGASSQGEAGQYIAEGLPDHLHIVSRTADITNEGAGTTVAESWDTVMDYNTQKTAYNFKTSLASVNNSIYGKSSHVTPETSVVLFGVYAFGAITNQGSLDAGTLATGLATVESNLEAKLDSSSLHIATAWSSGNTWYRKWSNGFIEQGGIVSSLANNTGTTVTLPLAFSSATYSILLSHGLDESCKYEGRHPIYFTNYLSASSFQIYNARFTGGGEASIVTNWYACGY